MHPKTHDGHDDRDMTDEEVEQLEQLRADMMAADSVRLGLQTSARNKLKALGLTDDEIAALVG